MSNKLILRKKLGLSKPIYSVIKFICFLEKQDDFSRQIQIKKGKVFQPYL